MNKEKTVLDYVHLCDYAVPGQGGKINIMGIFDFFRALKVNDFYLVAKLTVPKPGDYEVKIEIKQKDSSNDLLNTQISIQTPDPSFNMLHLMKNIVFPSYGQYNLIISVNDMPLAVLPFEVKNS